MAIVFEEVGAYQYKKSKEVESKQAGSDYKFGIKPGFEEEWRFGDEDTNDYWDRPDITKGEPIADE